MKYPPLIMDSGATFLYNKYIKENTKGAPGTHFKDKKKLNFSFYKTDTFLDFREDYIRFVLKNDKYLYAYVNMDIINNAEESYKSLKYMESKGCHPLPVFHLGNNEDWLRRYVDEGYKFICIGGITPNPYPNLEEPLDRIWGDILTDKQGMPKVKVHGLACTSYQSLVRHPWFSVDSATWTKLGAWGAIYVPRKNPKTGVFDFNIRPYAMQVSEKSSSVGKRNDHLWTITGKESNQIKEWLKHIAIPVGNAKEKGVINDYECRMKANLLFFQALCDFLPKWPWAFNKSFKKKGLF